MKRIFVIVLCFTNLVAFSQSILVNNQSVNVSSDISFPYWLDSTSTLEIDSNVVSISVLEFNITPTTNGNSLVFNQAKTVTSQETVPPGKTWKVESVLLDPSFVSTSNNSGTTTVVSGGGGSLRPVALSNESSSTMTLGDAALYCDSLVEDGYDNWVVPNEEELHFTSSGGGDVPGIRSSNYLWTYNRKEDNSNDVLCIRINTFVASWSNDPTDYMHVRCVRHATVTVSSGGGSSSSGGSGNMVSSALTPIAISAESPNTMIFDDAMLYCDSLDESGYQDWILPTLDEMTYIGSGGIDFPDTRSEDYLWTRSMITAGSSFQYVNKIRFSNSSNDGSNTISYDQTGYYPQNKTRCVRSGAVTVSSSGGGSSTPSTLGNGMPTMISAEQPNMELPDGIIYCDTLTEGGYSDWVVPSIEQLSYALSGGCVLPDSRTTNKIASRTMLQGSDIFYFRALSGSNGGGNPVGNMMSWGGYNGVFDIGIRCVR